MVELFMYIGLGLVCITVLAVFIVWYKDYKSRKLWTKEVKKYFDGL